MNVSDFLAKLENTPLEINFAETLATVEANYTFQETEFKNGEVLNEAGQNSGSCKVFAFAKLQTLDKEATLYCFGEYYRKDVLENPTGTDHANIRNFMVHGWEGIRFSGQALNSK